MKSSRGPGAGGTRPSCWVGSPAHDTAKSECSDNASIGRSTTGLVRPASPRDSRHDRAGRARVIDRTGRTLPEAGGTVATTSHARVAGLMLLAAVLGLGAVLSAPSRDPHRRHVAGRPGLGPAGVRRPATRSASPPRALVVLAFAHVRPRRLPAGRVSRVRRRDRRRGPRSPLKVLTVRWGYGRRLNDDLDLARFTLAAASAPPPAPCCSPSPSAVTGFGIPWAVVVSSWLTHLASQLILLAFFMEEFRHPGESGRTETLGPVDGVTILVTLARLRAHRRLPALSSSCCP